MGGKKSMNILLNICFCVSGLEWHKDE